MQFKNQKVQAAWDALASLCEAHPELRPELDDLIDKFVELLYRYGMTPKQEALTASP